MREMHPSTDALPSGTPDLAIPFPHDVRFVDTEQSDPAREQIEAALLRLSHFSDRITFARVNVRMPHKHGGKRAYHVHIEVEVPGKRLAVSREPEVSDAHCDLQPAIRDAFHKMNRLVEGYVKERNHHKGRGEHH